jgi:hypothetical protein
MLYQVIMARSGDNCPACRQEKIPEVFEAFSTFSSLFSSVFSLLPVLQGHPLEDFFPGGLIHVFYF